MDEVNFKYKYLKPYYTFSEILELFSFGEMTLRREMTKLTSSGIGLNTIGFFKLPGIKQWLVEPYSFEAHLKSLIQIQSKYDYEDEHQKKMVKGLHVVSNKAKQKGAINEH